MSFLTRWLLSVVGTAFLIAIADGLMLEKRVKEVGGLIGGMLLLLTLLSPLLQVHMGDLELSMDQYLEEIDQKIVFYQENQNEDFALRIKEDTESYIETVAQKMGLEITTDIEIKVAENGVPTPCRVRISGPYHAGLAKQIESDLGLPPEQQEWNTKEKGGPM